MNRVKLFAIIIGVASVGFIPGCGSHAGSGGSTSTASPSPAQGNTSATVGFTDVAGQYKLEKYFSAGDGYLSGAIPSDASACSIPTIESNEPYRPSQYFKLSYLSATNTISQAPCSSQTNCDDSSLAWRGFLSSRSTDTWTGTTGNSAVFSEAPGVSGCVLSYGQVVAKLAASNLDVTIKFYSQLWAVTKDACKVPDDIDSRKASMTCSGINETIATKL